MPNLARLACLLLGLILLVNSAARADDQISTPGEPLTFEVTDQATVNVWTDSYDNTPNQLTEQYYGPTFFNTFLDDNVDADVVFSGIPDIQNYSNFDSDLEAFQEPGEGGNSGGGSTDIVTNLDTWSMGLSHELFYNTDTDGPPPSALQHTWTITNNSDGEDASDVSLRYGGVTDLNDFYGANFSNLTFTMVTPPGLVFGESAYPSMIYVSHSQIEGYYGIYSDPSSTSGANLGVVSNYGADLPENLIPQISTSSSQGEGAASGILSDAVQTDTYAYTQYGQSTAAVALEWVIPGMSFVGEDSSLPSSVTLQAWETWSTGAQVQVSSPTVTPNDLQNPTFSTTNNSVLAGTAMPVAFTISDSTGDGNSYYLICQGPTQNGTAPFTIQSVTDSLGNALPTGPGNTPILSFPEASVQPQTVIVWVVGNNQLFEDGGTVGSYISMLALSTDSPNVGDQNNGPISIDDSSQTVTVATNDVTADEDVPATVQFTITNHEPIDDTFTITTGDLPDGMTLVNAPQPTSFFLSAGNAQVVYLQVTATGLAGTDENVISMTATSQTNALYTASAVANVSFSDASASVYSVTAGSFPTQPVNGGIYDVQFTLANNDTDNEDSGTFNIQVLPTPGLTILSVDQLDSQFQDSIGPFIPQVQVAEGASTTFDVQFYAEAGGDAPTSGSINLYASQTSEDVDGGDTSSAGVGFNFTPGTLVTLNGPTTQGVPSNSLQSASFTVTDPSADFDSYAITVSHGEDITIVSTIPELDGSIDLGGEGPESQTFTVQYIANGPGTITLQAHSNTDVGFTGQASVSVTIVGATSPVTVSEPPTQTTALGVPSTETFTITNNGAPDTFNLTLQSTQNLLILSPQGALAPVTLATGGTSTVIVTVFGQSGTAGAVSLTATSASVSSTSASGTTVYTLTPAIVTGQPVVVTPPAATPATAGTPVVLTFVVANNELISDSFSLQLVVPSGISILSVQQPLIQTSRHPTLHDAAPSLQPVALGPGGSASVVVTVVASPTSTASAESVQLIATSLSNETITSTASATVNVPATPTTAQPGSPVTVVSPTVAVSTDGNTVYGSISPGTPQAVTRLLNTLISLGPDQSVAYAWDASVQGFVQLPSQPAGGLLPTSGVFIASAVSLSFDLSGSSTLSPAPITLQPGWNFIGIPPIDPGNGGAILTTHAFPSDFDLVDGTGTVVTSASTFADTLGTVGSGDVSTAEPYLFNGLSYSQQPILTSGVGYWIKDNAPTAVTLQRVISGVTLSALASRTASAGGTYVDRGTPPTPPAASANHDSSSGGHCGSASGSAVLLMALGLIGWRRRRSRG